jgi:hypothetical protein
MLQFVRELRGALSGSTLQQNRSTGCASWLSKLAALDSALETALKRYS